MLGLRYALSPSLTFALLARRSPRTSKYAVSCLIACFHAVNRSTSTSEGCVSCGLTFRLTKVVLRDKPENLPDADRDRESDIAVGFVWEREMVVVVREGKARK